MKKLAGLGLLGAIVFGVGAAAAEPAKVEDPCRHVRFVEPTTEYEHGVLGDAVEWKALSYHLPGKTTGGASRTANGLLALGDGRVFEDTAPRCADLDGKGLHEIIVVESGVDEGAQLAIYSIVPKIEGAWLEKTAATDPIGTRFRWLAPAGIADFDGDGLLDIAYIETPHLAGVLHILTLEDGALRPVAESRAGFSNHRIGEDFISGGVRVCEDRVELITPDIGWDKVMAVEVVDGALVEREIGPFADLADLEAALQCPEVAAE